MGLYRLCTICNCKTTYGSKCKCEIDIIKEKDRKRHTAYSIKRLLDEEQKKYHLFYSGNAWDKVRDIAICNTVGVDVIEYYRTGKIIQGYTVHHIIELNSDWDRRLDVTNLIYLTQSNHMLVHKEYLKGEKEKKAMQRILIELKAKFMEEFGTTY